ncbi:unnamed protein product [Camellia sinensis]
MTGLNPAHIAGLCRLSARAAAATTVNLHLSRHSPDSIPNGHVKMASSSSYSNSPCDACKFLRRKCLPGCLFAPSFPPEEPPKFANVHKIFGASNVSKLLNEIPPHQREDAVNSLAYEAQLCCFSLSHVTHSPTYVFFFFFFFYSILHTPFSHVIMLGRHQPSHSNTSCSFFFLVPLSSYFFFFFDFHPPLSQLSHLSSITFCTFPPPTSLFHSRHFILYIIIILIIPKKKK